MAKTAGITIAISGSYNGKALANAQKDLEKMKAAAAAASGGASSALMSLGGSIAEVGGKIHNIGYQMESIGTAATKNITVPITAAAVACGKAAIDIDTALTGVKKTVDGTAEQYDQLKEAAIAFSQTNAVSASQILDIQALGAQLGFTIDELDMFSEVVSGLDIATDMDADTAATELAQFANITRMSHDAVENYASAIVNLGNNMATTESAISSMAMRTAAASTQVGMSQKEILGWSSAMSSLGVEAEAGGTAFSNTISTIDAAVATGSDALQAFADVAGMSAEEFAASWKNSASETLVALLEGTDGAENMTVALESMGVTGIRQSDVLKRLAGNTDLVTQALELSSQGWEENAALQKEVENRNESMAAKLQILQNKLTAIAEDIGTPLVNALTAAIDAADPLIQGIASASQAFADMDTETQQLILSLVGVAASFGPVLTIAGKLTKGIGNLVVGAGKLVQKLAIITNEGTAGGKALSALSSGASSATSAVSATAGAATVATTATKALSAALKSCGVMFAVLTAIDLGVKFVEWVKSEMEMQKATSQLTTATQAAARAYDSWKPAIDSAKNAMADYSSGLDAVLSEHEALADSITSTASTLGTNAAQVDYYSGRIEELTSKTHLSASEQAELQAAVDGFNGVTGASISVIDAQNGMLSQSADNIRAIGDAYVYQAEKQAYAELYQESVKQMVSDMQQLATATEKLNTASKGIGLWVGDFPIFADSASVSYHQLESDVNDLQSALSDSTNTADYYKDALGRIAQTFPSFEDALSSCGTSLSDFGAISSEQLDALEADFDGSLASIISSCETNGIQIPQALANSMTLGAPTVAAAAQNITGMSEAELISFAQQAGIEGDAAMTNFYTAITNNGGNIQAAANYAKSEAVNGIQCSNETGQAGNLAGLSFSQAIQNNNSNARSAAETLARSAEGGANTADATGAGSNFGAGFVNGISGWLGRAANAAASLAASAYNALTSALAEHSPSRKTMQAGGYFSEGFQIGIEKEQRDAVSQASLMGYQATRALTASLGTASVNTNLTATATAPSSFGLASLNIIAQPQAVVGASNQEIISWLAANLPLIIQNYAPQTIIDNDAGALIVDNRLNQLQRKAAMNVG